MLVAILASGYGIGLGLDENTAAVVGRDNRLGIVGRSGAVLLDPAGVDADASLRPLRLNGARLSLLGPGDVYDPSSGRVTAAAPRAVAEHPAGPASASHDILGRNALVALLSRRSSKARHVADRVASDPGSSGRAAFAFRFRRLPDTQAYGGPGAFTILGVGLDVGAVDATRNTPRR